MLASTRRAPPTQARTRTHSPVRAKQGFPCSAERWLAEAGQRGTISNVPDEVHDYAIFDVGLERVCRHLEIQRLANQRVRPAVLFVAGQLAPISSDRSVVRHFPMATRAVRSM